MSWRTVALAAALSLTGLPGIAGAQQTEGEQPHTQARASTAPQVDVSKLPLNLARVQRQLRQTIEREQRDGNMLRYTIDVFAEAPPLVIFGPETDLRFGPVPYSAPTHQEMLNIVTPQEFRSPIMNFGNLLNLFGGGSKNDEKKK